MQRAVAGGYASAGGCCRCLVLGGLLLLLVAPGLFGAPPARVDTVTVYGTASYPSGRHDRVVPPSEAVALSADLLAREIRLPPVDTAALLQEDAQRTGDIRPRVGVSRDLPPISEADGAWHPVPGVGRVWVLAIASQDAFEIRVHFSRVKIPAGGELYVHAPASAQDAAGPYGGTGPFDHGAFWSDMFTADTVVVEYFLPAGTPSAGLPFVIDRVMHAYVDTFAKGGLREGACHEDVQCYYPAWEDVSNCVARILFNDPPGSGSWYLCSGSLIDTVIGDETPYFMTANHCIPEQGVAETMVARFKYESTFCDSGTPGSSWQQTSGADLWMTNTDIDFSLCMINAELPTNILPFFWTGWSNDTVPDLTDLTCVSHPAGAYKRLTLGYKPGDSGPYKHSIVWTAGTIEGGSSGSGVWREDLGGQLYAGTASTSTLPIGCTNPDGPSQYGRFDLAYPYVSGYLAGGTDDSLENNDSCATAPATPSAPYYNLIVKRLDEDWYRISVGPCQSLDVTLLFTDVNGNIDAELYDACGGTVLASGTTLTNDENFTYDNPTNQTQEYLLRVFLAADTRNGYTLYFTATGECQPCVALGARSYKDHGAAGRLAVDMGVTEGIEPRKGGITELEVDLDTAAGFFGGVTLDCSASGDVSARVSGTSTNGNTVTVTFDPAPPNTEGCVVGLDCGGSLCVWGLEGDTDRNSIVGTSDASIIKPLYGSTPGPGTAEYDYDTSGVISTTDFSLIKPKYEHRTVYCPY